MQQITKRITDFINTLDNINNVVVVVGAGISVGSGLTTFRGPGGLYENKTVEELASRAGFAEDPLLVWSWYKARMERMFEVEPNSAHHALVKLERRGLLSLLITQNVDGLHRRAGQSKLIEIHGTVVKTHCFDHCGRTAELDGPPEDIPVKCECGSYQRPSVVWFGEQLNSEHLQKVDEVIDNADLMITVGTSGYVYPVANFPFVAKHKGVKLVDFNINRTQISDMADLFVQVPSEISLPIFVDELIVRNF